MPIEPVPNIGNALQDSGKINEIIDAVNGNSNGTFVNLVVTGNTALGNAITDTIGFYGKTPVAQQASASQAAVSTATITPLATTAATQTTPWGFASQAQGDAIATQVNLAITRCAALTVLVNELRADLVTAGLIKGAA